MSAFIQTDREPMFELDYDSQKNTAARGGKKENIWACQSTPANEIKSQSQAIV